MCVLFAVYCLEVTPLDRYVRSACVCNTLALLVSQGTMIEFLERISLLIRLQNCWTKGHTDIKLHCSSNNEPHDEMFESSSEDFTSDNSLLQPAFEEMAGSPGGDEEVPENSSENRNETSLSVNEHNVRKSRNRKVTSGVIFQYRITAGSKLSVGRHVKRGPRRRKKNTVLQHMCSECGRQFSNRHLLVTHLVTHSGERPFPCRIPGCDKRFGQSSTRNYHERTHSDARPYVCSHCGLGFKLAPVLRLHVARMHSVGESMHCCDQCSRRFKLIGGLRAHIRTVHSQDRPHACDACPKRFKTRHQLVRHTRDMHCTEKPLHCPVCNRAFTQACNMRTHMRTHTGEKPFHCHICSVRFAHSGSLKAHLFNHGKSTQQGDNRTEHDSVNGVETSVTVNSL